MDTQLAISCVVRFPWRKEINTLFSLLCFHNSVFALFFIYIFYPISLVTILFVMWVMMMQRLLPETDTQQHESYRKEADFDTNIVIILGCLLCALICALGLNSIVRCALRCSRRLVYEGGDVAATGVKKKALKRIPVTVYGAGLEIPVTECPICLGEFVDGEKVRVLPQCGHGFHVRCIDVWLGSHSSCPTCRRLVVETPAVVGRSLGGGVVVQEGG